MLTVLLVVVCVVVETSKTARKILCKLIPSVVIPNVSKCVLSDLKS